MSRTAAAILIGLLVALPLSAQKPPIRIVADGHRVLEAISRRDEGQDVALDTVFGELRFPRARLKAAPSQPTALPVRRTTRTKWFAVSTDLDERRHRLYVDRLESFAQHMTRVYGLRESTYKHLQPFSINVFRRRSEFKKTQARLAPLINERKGQAFGEGITGFYAPGPREVYMWDGIARGGGDRLNVAQHEVTHLFNHLLRDEKGLKVPTWFEEGAATYFAKVIAIEAAAGVTAEPEDDLASIAQITADIRSKTPYSNANIRGVPYDTFYGREYSWGWALIRYLRQERGGKHWPMLMKLLRGGTAGKSKGFARAFGFKSDEAFDRAWHKRLLAIAPASLNRPLRTEPRVLAAINSIQKPTARQAATFLDVGLSYARAGMPELAAAFLRAAHRGGVDSAMLRRELARAIAEHAGSAEDDIWPDEAVKHLHRAVVMDALDAQVRLLLAGQLAISGRADDMPAAILHAGLALICSGQGDDPVDAAAVVLGLHDGDIEAEVARLSMALPGRAAALRQAHVQVLQQRQSWNAMLALLEARNKSGDAARTDLRLLAELWGLVDRLEESAALYAKMLAADPDDHDLRPGQIKTLMSLGRKGEAAAAKKSALERLAATGRDTSWLEERLERALRGR